MGLPWTNPGISTGVDPVKKKPERENPRVALFTTVGEKIWVSLTLATWFRTVTSDR